MGKISSYFFLYFFGWMDAYQLQQQHKMMMRWGLLLISFFLLFMPQLPCSDLSKRRPLKCHEMSHYVTHLYSCTTSRVEHPVWKVIQMTLNSKILKLYFNLFIIDSLEFLILFCSHSMYWTVHSYLLGIF